MITSEYKGDKLIITVDCSGKPYQSKSALAKAAEKGLDLNTVPATSLATSGGFIRQGAVKFSLNVMKA